MWPSQVLKHLKMPTSYIAKYLLIFWEATHFKTAFLMILILVDFHKIFEDFCFVRANCFPHREYFPSNRKAVYTCAARCSHNKSGWRTRMTNTDAYTDDKYRRVHRWQTSLKWNVTSYPPPFHFFDKLIKKGIWIAQMQSWPLKNLHQICPS